MKLKENYVYKRELKNKLYINDIDRSKQSQSYDLKKKKYDGILYIKKVRKNTFFTLTDSKGKIKEKSSSRSLGFKGKTKVHTKFAFDTSLHALCKKAASTRKKYLLVSFQNPFFHIHQKFINRVFEKHELKIVGINQLPRQPHNGCRPKKKRRL